MDWVLGADRRLPLPGGGRAAALLLDAAAPEQPPAAGGGRPPERAAARERAGQPRRQGVRQEDYEQRRLARPERAALPPLHARQPHALAARSRRCSPGSPSPASSGTAARSVIAGTRTQGDFLAFLTTLVLLYEPFKRLVRTERHDPAGPRGRRARLRAARHAGRGRRPARRARRCAAMRRGHRVPRRRPSSTSPASRCCATSTCASRRARWWRWSA